MRAPRSRSFWILLAASGAAALLMPRMERLEATAALALAPVALPAHRTAGWLNDALADDGPVDHASPGNPREIAEVYAENERLRQVGESLLGQLRALQELNVDREALGTSLRQRSRAMRVIGARAAGEEVLMLGALPGSGGVEEGMPVLFVGGAQTGIAGRIAAGGGAVRLISDPRSTIEARFLRIDPESGMPLVLDTERTLVEGAGDGMLIIRRHRLNELESAGVTPGTWAVLDDPDWPEILRHRRLGRVHAVEPLADEPGFARVVLEPGAQLHKLREVMVVVE